MMTGSWQERARRDLIWGILSLCKRSHGGRQWNRQRGPRMFRCKDTHSCSINLPRVGHQRDHVSFALLRVSKTFADAATSHTPTEAYGSRWAAAAVSVSRRLPGPYTDSCHPWPGAS
jgi:hypothetical protein